VNHEGKTVEGKITQHRAGRRGSITVSATLIHELRIEAKRRGLKVEDLAATILRAVVADDLYAAVIDR
jgi:CHAD domain-containing protein